MGRSTGPSRVHVLALIALLVLAIACVVAYVIVARIPVPFFSNTAQTNAAPRPLADLALTKSEIEHALQASEPLTFKYAQVSCGVQTALECFEASYTASSGGLLTLLLAGFSSPEGAVDFGIATRVQQEQEQHASEISIPTTAANFSWLDAGLMAGKPVYYGGANEKSIAVFLTWGPASVSISQDQVVQTYSRLLEAQIRKIRSRISK
jgi:hypothetical protein